MEQADQVCQFHLSPKVWIQGLLLSHPTVSFMPRKGLATSLPARGPVRDKDRQHGAVQTVAPTLGTAGHLIQADGVGSPQLNTQAGLRV